MIGDYDDSRWREEEAKSNSRDRSPLHGTISSARNKSVDYKDILSSSLSNQKLVHLRTVFGSEQSIKDLALQTLRSGRDSSKSEDIEEMFSN